MTSVIGDDALSSPPRPGPRGFTLIEVAVVLFLITIVVAAAIPVVLDLSKHESLRETSRTLRAMAKTAQSQAVRDGKPYAIEFDRRAFVIRAADPDAAPLHTYPVGEGIGYEIRTHLSDRWQPPDGQRWFFLPSGVTAPMEVTMRSNRAWILLRFDPLTANVAQESNYFP